ncbi:MAG: Flp pilus assembly complex ATPase component TadA [Sedimentisphaerales bacterium]|nr:Flp pilus assembly complex ATPase component TadA [Sedimentisphaerales bacterium]
MTTVQTKRLGELLCEKSYLDESQLDHALSEQKGLRLCLGQILLNLGYITPVQLTEALALQAGIERIDPTQVSIEPAIVSQIPAELVSKYNVFPLWQRNSHLAVAMVDPFDSQALEDLRVVTGCSIRRYFGHPHLMEQAISKFYGSHVARMLENLAPKDQADDASYENGEYSPAKLHELAREPSLVNLVNLILYEAIDARASDVHIEPFEHQLKIKYRIDGMLLEKSPSPKRLQAAIVSRIKIMAGMNIAERFIPQDGHIEFSGHSGKIDIRVSTVPTIFGESITMRILDRSASLIRLEELGMNERVLRGFKQSLHKSHGLLLVTGPTGSGKTTTLYAALNKIYTPSQKIITIEDPVEYQLDGIIQMPVNPKRGLTFATGLRHIVRQDPDIIMVGEIRDRETADIAIRSALTGHLVFSTLHTNDAPGAITRLLDMGVEPFLLASSLEVVLAQRLVRRICQSCKEAYHPNENLLRSLNGTIQVAADQPFYHGRGCAECMNSGMRGRIGIFELLRITDEMRPLITNRPTTDQILKAAPGDHAAMRIDGIEKILKGTTSLEEVVRVTQGFDE